MPSKSSAGTPNFPIEKSKIPEKLDVIKLVQTIPEFEKVTGEGVRDLKNAVNNFKAHFIQKVLEENDWNQTEAAKELNIQRTYLSRLIKDLSINKKIFCKQA
jgi:transcriptional regulator with PAS, ATPase and Fis domain